MKTDQMPKLLAGLATVILAVTLAVLLFLPKASSKAALAKTRKTESRDRLAAHLAEKNAAIAQSVVTLRTWPGTQGTITPLALARVSAIAAKRGVKISAFRPQRINTGGELSQLPFVATVDGPFPNVVRFVRDVEAPSTKLAVNLVQISSSDEQSDRVTATVGLLAYMAPEAPPNG